MLLIDVHCEVEDIVRIKLAVCYGAIVCSPHTLYTSIDVICDKLIAARVDITDGGTIH